MRWPSSFPLRMHRRVSPHSSNADALCSRGGSTSCRFIPPVNGGGYESFQLLLLEIDDAADFAAFAHVCERVVDLIEPVATGHQLVELEVTVAIHRQQHRHTRAGIHPTVKRPLELF